MDFSVLRQTLQQLLENYQRSGITHIQRGAMEELPAAVLQQLDAWKQTRSHPPNSPPVSTIGSTASGADARPPRQAILSQPIPEQAQKIPGGGDTAATVGPASSISPPNAPTGAWQLPVLDLESRRAQFDVLKLQIAACTLCKDIVSYRQQIVFGSGNLQPRLCFFGEAPGADEDRTGEPFVGKAGQLLTKIITAMQLKREEVFILTALKCRPPQNRTPVPDEIANCRPFVAAQLEALQPEYIVCLGAVAAQSLLNSTEPIGRLRGRFHQYRGAKVVVTYHPSYLLSNESAKRLVWEDMKMLMRAMEEA